MNHAMKDNRLPLGLFSVIAVCAAPVSAHVGGLDRCGGHNDHKNGGYHAHDAAAARACAAPKPSPKPSPKPTAAPTLPNGFAGNNQIASFNRAKKLAFGVYEAHPITLYCGCRFNGELIVDHQSCGYQAKGTSARAQRVEWEHVVPAEAFGQSFAAWREGDPACRNSRGEPFAGRHCAGKVSGLFRLMEADLYNLYPAIGEVNNLRSNFSMAELSGEPREFGACDVEIRGGKFEPRPEIRGDIARTYLYMEQAYPGRGIVSAKNRKLFESWDRQDPVDGWECQRAARVALLQGNVNTVVTSACAILGLP